MIIINGKKFDPAKSKNIFQDGTFSDRGVVYFLTPSGNIVEKEWSQWQGEGNAYRVISRKKFIEIMKGHWHKNRAWRALDRIGATSDIEEL